MPKYRILIVVPHYSNLEGSPTMADDLAAAFADLGHDVQVIALLWNAKPDQQIYRNIDRSGVNVLRVHPTMSRGGRFVRLISKWVFSSYMPRRRISSLLKDSSFDLLVCWSPAVTTSGIVNWALKKFKPRSFVHVVDFFPFHQSALGLIPNGIISKIAKMAENAMLRKFDAIGCMSPANIEFLQANYKLPKIQKHFILPVFAEINLVPPLPREEVRNRYSLPIGRPIALFGGQLTEGRGLDEILEAAAISYERGLDLCFLMIGQGRLENLVSDYIASGRGNLFWINGLPRSEYLNVASACDFGLVVTVAGVGVPTFPSKTIDYLRAALPIVASVEDSTDYGAFIERQGLGKAITAGNPRALLEAILALDRDFDRATFLQNSRGALLRYFSSTSAVENILRETGLQG